MSTEKDQGSAADARVARLLKVLHDVRLNPDLANSLEWQQHAADAEVSFDTTPLAPAAGTGEFAKLQGDLAELMGVLSAERDAEDDDYDKRFWGKYIKLVAAAIAALTTPRPAQTEKGNDMTTAGLLEEAMRERPEPKNPTLWRYLQNAHEKQVTFHALAAHRQPDGGFLFYIHPASVSGDTEDYFIWPDPFNWEDMIVNKKDCPPPDVEKFKKLLEREFPTDRAAMKGST